MRRCPVGPRRWPNVVTVDRYPGTATSHGHRSGTACAGGPAHTMAGVELIRVVGGPRLTGEVSVVGAKNSALKLMAAALLAPGRTELSNVPEITDIAIMAEVLRRLGCEVRLDEDRVTIDVPEEIGTEADYDL